jgi:hypothetical protein
MDLRSMGLYLNKSGWRAEVIHDDLVETVAREATAHSTVTKYHREAQIGPRDAVPFSDALSPHIDH